MQVEKNEKEPKWGQKSGRDGTPSKCPYLHCDGSDQKGVGLKKNWRNVLCSFDRRFEGVFIVRKGRGMDSTLNWKEFCRAITLF